MEIYCVFQEGVYRHDCFGVFNNKEKAIALANKIAKEDVDNHHDYLVIPFILNKAVATEDAGLRTSPKAIEETAIYRTDKRKAQHD